ncbi:MAG: class I SAM-dependent methyltransferase [Deltaproteobacteria bacterium]
MTNGTSDFDAKASTWDADPSKVDRARRVAEAIARDVPDLAGRSVLDYGAGTGLLGFHLLPHASRITFADVSKGMLAVVEEKIAKVGAGIADAILLDLTRDPPPARRFGLVCTLMALHHVPDVDGILKAFHSTLEPGGVLCISDLDLEDGSFHGPGVGVHHGFVRAALERKIRAAGFGPVRFSTPCDVRKEAGGESRTYPIFLAVATRIGD